MTGKLNSAGGLFLTSYLSSTLLTETGGSIFYYFHYGSSLFELDNIVTHAGRQIEDIIVLKFTDGGHKLLSMVWIGHLSMIAILEYKEVIDE